MIVDPNFLEHWKTQQLISILKDKSAPCLLIRLWGFCQQQKKWIFPGMTPEILGIILKIKKNQNQVVNALLTVGFLHRVEDSYVVHQWEVHNAKLIAAWENGSKGGRPKGTVGLNKITQGEPKPNPSLTQAKPIGEDRSGVERKGSERKEIPSTEEGLKSILPDILVSDSEMVSSLVEWVQYRKEIKHPLTSTGLAAQVKSMAEMGPARAKAMIRHTIIKGWQGLVEPDIRNGIQTHKPAEQHQLQETITIKSL